ncbi:CLUMA_CG020824, isoform A [Clunio marinus]|uniref:Period circadian protein n=1 Tax=Clunio marinus TaxID=568069 RepID=A0A1J1J8R8_9DIPT|nr:CLUMA_CG020824, isoform A [Clunio marinus]
MESTESTHNTKASDSAYSNFCSNSQSENNSGNSSKSRHDGNNSPGSSGYGGKPPTGHPLPQPLSKRSKDRKKKKLKSTIHANASTEADERNVVITETILDNNVERITEENDEHHQQQLTESSTLINAKTSDGIQSPATRKTCEEDFINPDISNVSSPNFQQPREPTKTEKNTDEGFCCVMSMHDGVVLYTTPSITNSLAFPRDMWLGRSFIDFVHPKDRSIFANQITSGVALAEARSSKNNTKQSLFAMLRRYRGLKSGFGVTNKSVSYEAFKLNLTFREAPLDEVSHDAATPSVNSSMLLIISATPVKTFYKKNDEVLAGTRDHAEFTTRHTASGVLSNVDGTASLLGFFPQDILGKKIMEFYHPEDMALLKGVYEKMMKKGRTGASFRSKPYRFLTHNGCYITVETEWSSFVNPWSHHLEFVIGYHSVLKGPTNPNVLAENTSEGKASFPDNVLKKSKIIQDEILKLLTEQVSRPTETAKQQVSRRCQVLASFMETLLEEVTKTGSKNDMQVESMSSSDSPPSYNQLNYKENLQRFFDSRPVTIDESEVQKMEQTDSEPDARTNISPSQCFDEMATRTNVSPLQCFGGSSRSDSAGNLSSTGNANAESITNTSRGTSNNSYVPQKLTEALLCKHDEDMEELIIKRHKLTKSSGKSCDKVKKCSDKTNEYHSHGVKRSGSRSWEGQGDAHKSSKQHHTAEPQKAVASIFPNQTNPNVELWPPFSVSLTTLQSTLTTSQATEFPASNLFPTVYYLAQTIPQCMQSVIYQPLIYSHPSTFYQMNFQATQSSRNELNYNTSYQFVKNATVPALQTPADSDSIVQSLSLKRPPSQATSVKADMGSTSASVNRALSETSRKGVLADSPLPHDGPSGLNINDNEASGLIGISEDESNYSSFYSSFLKTDEAPSSSNEGRGENSTIQNKAIQWDEISKPPIRRANPHWIENINLTNELVFRYQLDARTLKDVLNDDMYTLKKIHQPDLVNDQLDQLYLDLEVEDSSTRIALESTSGSSGEEDNSLKLTKKKKIHYSKLVFTYEENCPLPSE